MRREVSNRLMLDFDFNVSEKIDEAFHFEGEVKSSFPAIEESDLSHKERYSDRAIAELQRVKGLFARHFRIFSLSYFCLFNMK